MVQNRREALINLKIGLIILTVVEMALATITFWGETSNSYGIPTDMHMYLVSVYVNQVIGQNDRIVKIVPLTDTTAKPKNELPFIVRNSTEEEAISKAFNILSEMSILQGLENFKSIIKNKKERLSPLKLKVCY